VYCECLAAGPNADVCGWHRESRTRPRPKRQLGGADEPEASPLIKYLDDSREQDLLQQLAEIRDRLSRAGDYSLDTTDWTTAEDDNGVTVTVSVSLVQTTTDRGRILFNETSAVRWTIHTINDQGLFIPRVGTAMTR
jgi:hypothetical protein